MSLKERLKENTEKNQLLPVVLIFVLLAILFIFMRMRGVEQNYELNELSYKVNEMSIDNKEYKAQKARLLSVKRLREFARKYDLKEPDQQQVILVP